MPRRFRMFAVAAALGAVAIAAVLPPAAKQTALPPASTVRGAFHIHSDRSDGSGSVEAIAAAAGEAGLQFIILTDHGDGTRQPDPPAYRGTVLTIDGVEVNTTGGHYAVIGMPASPYPLAGTPADVIEDVHRLGGFGFAAHPGSPRPALSWQDWHPPVDGLEWMNADSEWRDEPRLPIARALLTYLIRAPESMASLLDRPDAVLRQWDVMTQARQVVALAGTDAHARLGFRQGTDPDVSSFHVRLPGYESSFRAFSNHVELDAPLSGDAGADAQRIVDAIRAGRTYSVIDALATPGRLSFTATSGAHTARMGESLRIGGDVALRASTAAPPRTRIVLLRNGQRISEVTDGPLEVTGGQEPAVYRVEVYTARAPGGPPVPWIVSNPIYAGLGMPSSPVTVAEPQARIPARAGEAAAEAGQGDTSLVTTAIAADARARTFAGDPAIEWKFSLSPGIAAGQFAAVRVPVSPGLSAFDRVRFMVSASAPMRVWVQLRAPVGNTERWGATFYADTEPRLVDVAFAKFNPIGETSTRSAPFERVDSLLLVVDTLNSLPGRSGSMTISELAFVK